MYQVTQTTQDRSNFTLDRSAYLVTVHILNGADGKLESGLSVEKRAGAGQTEPGAKARVFCLQIAIHGRQGAVVILEAGSSSGGGSWSSGSSGWTVASETTTGEPTESFPGILFPSRRAVLPQPLSCRTGDLTP
ncbi:MAG: hypothetical protein V8S27_03280 [Lachnospiraceae bacterium]